MSSSVIRIGYLFTFFRENALWTLTPVSRISSLSRIDACDGDRAPGLVYCERHAAADATRRYMESVLAQAPESA